MDRLALQRAKKQQANPLADRDRLPFDFGRILLSYALAAVIPIPYSSSASTLPR